MKEFTVAFCLTDSEYFTALRLVGGAVCATPGVDVDTIEDFKVCLTESALILKNCGYQRVKAVFHRGAQVGVTLYGLGGTYAEGDNELSLALISALVSACEIARNQKNQIESIALTI